MGSTALITDMSAGRAVVTTTAREAMTAPPRAYRPGRPAPGPHRDILLSFKRHQMDQLSAQGPGVGRLEALDGRGRATRNRLAGPTECEAWRSVFRRCRLMLGMALLTFGVPYWYRRQQLRLIPCSSSSSTSRVTSFSRKLLVSARLLGSLRAPLHSGGALEDCAAGAGLA